MHFAVFQSLLLVLSDRNPKADCSGRPSYRGAVSVLHFSLEKVTYIYLPYSGMENLPEKTQAGGQRANESSRC